MTILFLFLLTVHLFCWFVVLRILFWKNFHDLVPLSPAHLVRLESIPKISVLVPARNEEKYIRQSVMSLLRQDYENLQIIVIDDRSNDRTGEILRKLQEQYPKRLTIVQGTDPPDGWMGKCHALYLGFQSVDAQSKWLVFADADIIHQPATIRRAVYQAEQRQVNLLTMFPTVWYVGFWEHIILGVLTHLGIAGLKVSKIHDQNSPHYAGIGAFTMLERKSYNLWGGHKAIKGEVIDDMALGMKVKESGGSILFTKDDGAVSLRMYDSLKSICDGFMKNIQTGIGGGITRSILAGGFICALHMFPVFGVIFGIIHYSTVSGMMLLLISLVLYFATGISLEARVSRLVHLKPGRIAVGYPLGTVLCLLIIIRSMWYSYVKKEIRWRGRSITKPEQKVRLLDR